MKLKKIKNIAIFLLSLQITGMFSSNKKCSSDIPNFTKNKTASVQNDSNLTHDDYNKNSIFMQESSDFVQERPPVIKNRPEFIQKNPDFINKNQELSNYLDISHSNDFNSLETKDKSVFLCGESHATQKNFDVQLALIKHLSSTDNLKYIIAEDSFSNSIAINNYINTGDISELDEIFQDLKSTYVGSKENYNFYKNLYELNKNLPTDKKLKYIGIDIEHQDSNAKKCLRNLMKKTKCYKENEELREDLDSDNVEDLSGTAYCLYRDFFDKGNEDELKEDLSETDFWNLKFLLENLINTGEYRATLKLETGLNLGTLADDTIRAIGDEYYRGNITPEYIAKLKKQFNSAADREASIYKNFKKIYERFSDGKFYGQWGLEHTFLNGVKTSNIRDENFQRFAMQLDKNNDSPVKGKVCTIATYYINSQQMDSETTSPCPIDNTCSNQKKERDILEFYTNDSINLFRLDNENSPLKKELYFLYPQISKDVPRVTTDFFQYIITIKDSLACTPY